MLERKDVRFKLDHEIHAALAVLADVAKVDINDFIGARALRRGHGIYSEESAMGLLSRIRDAFRTPPRIKNRVGGMAWVRPYGGAFGAHVLTGRAVRTVRLLDTGLWEIDPPQCFVITGNRAIHCIPNNRTFQPGTAVALHSLADECLEPWREDGITDEEVRDLYASQIKKEPSNV